MNEEKGQWRHPRLSDRDLLLCIGRDLRRLYEDTLRQKIEQVERERTLRKQ
jgi:hypothetical protein